MVFTLYVVVFSTLEQHYLFLRVVSSDKKCRFLVMAWKGPPYGVIPCGYSCFCIRSIKPSKWCTKFVSALVWHGEVTSFWCLFHVVLADFFVEFCWIGAIERL
jgi:hypothetical protein